MAVVQKLERYWKNYGRIGVRYDQFAAYTRRISRSKKERQFCRRNVDTWKKPFRKHPSVVQNRFLSCQPKISLRNPESCEIKERKTPRDNVVCSDKIKFRLYLFANGARSFRTGFFSYLNASFASFSSTKTRFRWYFFCSQLNSWKWATKTKGKRDARMPRRGPFSGQPNRTKLSLDNTSYLVSNDCCFR